MNPIEQAQAHLAEIEQIEKDIAGLKRQQAANATELQKLEAEGDLNDPEILAAIGSKRDFAGLIPTRIAAVDAKRRELQEQCDDFVNGPLQRHVSLAIWEIGERVGAHARAALEPIFEAHEIADLVRKTKVVRHVDSLRSQAGNNLTQTPAKYFFEKLVAALTGAQEFAKSLNL